MSFKNSTKCIEEGLKTSKTNKTSKISKQKGEKNV